MSQKVIRKPFKKIFCNIAWKVLAKLLQRFGNAVDIGKTHFKKFYCKVLQILPEMFLVNFLQRNISWDITKRFQKDFSETFSYKSENVRKIFPKPSQNISRKVTRKQCKNISCIIAWNITNTFQKDCMERLFL